MEENTGMAPEDRGPVTRITHEEGQFWIGEFIKECSIHLSPETVDTYRRKLEQFINWWATQHSNDAYTVQLAYAYAKYRESQPGSIRSQALHLAVLKRWGQFLVIQGRVSHNPWSRVVPPRQPVWLATDWLTLAEIRRLLMSFDHTRLSQQRDALICRIMLKTGARETELAKAKVENIRPLGTEAWLFLRSKGKRKEEPVLLVRPLKEELDRYLRRRYPDGVFPPDAPLFTTYYDEEERPIPLRELRRRIGAALKRAKIARAGITPLSLRHTAGKQALAKQAPLSAVQEMMRHESITTTKRLAEQEHRRTYAAERFLTHY